MKPLSLSPAEVKQALETGEVTLERVMEPQPPENAEMVEFHQNEAKGLEILNDKVWWFTAAHGDMWPCSHDEAIPSPFGSIGQEFWVKEGWFNHIYPEQRGDVEPIYKADNDCIEQNFEWQSAETMPQEASRLTLIHKETKVEQRDAVWVWVGRMGVKNGD